MTELAETVTIPASADRTAGLIVFGAIQIVIGIACGVLLLGSAAGSEVARHQGAEAGATLASSLVAYGMATVYFISAGIGSIRKRRWARALSLVVSAIWLAAGVVATLALMIALPALAPNAPIVGIVAGAAVAMIVLPGALVLFYRSEAVRLTCEGAGAPSWTDRVPLPVLAVALTLAFASVIMLANLGNPVLTLFGSNVSGAPAAVALLAFAMLCAFLAVQLYRLKESAWGTLVLLQLLGCAAGILTLVAGRGSAGQEGEAISRSPLLVGLIIVTWIVYFAFLLYLRRYFRLAPRTRRNDVPTVRTIN